MSADTIEAAEWVLLVTSTPVDMSRFVGKRVFQSTPAQALQDVEAVLRRGAEEAQVYVAPEAVVEPVVAVKVLRAWSRSLPAQPASRTPSWPPKPCSKRPSVWATNCKWKPKARSVRETPLSAAAIADADVVLLAATSKSPPSVLPARKSTVAAPASR